MRARVIIAFVVGITTGIAVSVFVASYGRKQHSGWNSNAITASVRSVGQLADGSVVIVDVAMKNHTAADYKLARPDQLNVMLRTAEGLHAVQEATLETPIFIPAGEIANSQLRLPVLPLVNVALAERTESQNGKQASRGRWLIPPQVTAIEVFDEAHRYVITIARKW